MGRYEQLIAGGFGDPSLTDTSQPTVPRPGLLRQIKKIMEIPPASPEDLTLAYAAVLQLLTLRSGIEFDKPPECPFPAKMIRREREQDPFPVYIPGCAEFCASQAALTSLFPKFEVGSLPDSWNDEKTPAGWYVYYEKPYGFFTGNAESRPENVVKTITSYEYCQPATVFTYLLASAYSRIAQTGGIIPDSYVFIPGSNGNGADSRYFTALEERIWQKPHKRIEVTCAADVPHKTSCFVAYFSRVDDQAE